ncbi:HesA/MoeB/ThiF family protein [Sphaerisporangium perillae]|uniref:HesA/MoeB/ThiF family protein n=1 Tax=Sphaerisporangium perillae TaxID=2935860 RepID=UPI00200F8EE7|nr:ThiF family adenylyltransferase [Sphaerisporangium perillae]
MSLLRPRVKAEHRPHRYADGTVRIGGEIYGLAAEIDDPDGWVWAALSLMDGTLPVAQITSRLALAFRELSAAQAESLVAQLIASGYLEDAAAVPPPELSAREVDRYSRNHAFFRQVDLAPREHGWEAQLRLRNARVVVLGLGGTGSHAAWALAAAGVGRLHCVDPDVVEPSNLNRQVLYGEADIGRAKADVAVRRLRAVNSDVTITGERLRVGGQEELAELVSGADMLALCADEPRGHGLRVWANRACASAGIPWAGGGYSGPLVTVGVYEPGHPCYECVSAGERARRRPGTPVDLGGPGVIATSAGISGHLVAHAVITQLTGIPAIPPGRIGGLNLIAPDHLIDVRHPARDDCPVCGREATPPKPFGTGLTGPGP